MLPLRPAVAAALLAALGALALLAAPGRAGASSHVRFGIKDDAWLMSGPGTVDSRVAELQALGVQVVRFTLRWDKIAPERPRHAADPLDPAYRWDGRDAVLRSLHEHGIEAIVGVTGTPAWANGGHPSNWAPKRGATYAAFVTAAAKLYPWVRRWLVWNEPNQRIWLRPASPKLYVNRLLNPAYAALHRTLRHVQVGAGVTAPRGGVGGVSPVDWIAGMDKAHAHLDAYAHNPYPLNVRETPFTGGCDHCLTVTMATLPRLLRDVRKAFGTKTRVWLTEYGYQTNPPDPLLGVSPALQARYVGEGALRAYLAPRVDVLIHFLYRDEPGLGRFQSGLTWVSGRAKPALRAFQLPLAQRARHGGKVTLWGQLRLPEASSYRLQVYRGHWRALTPKRRAKSGGFFTWTGTLKRGTKVRLVAGGVASPVLRIA